jgi:hypothetical protein
MRTGRGWNARNESAALNVSNGAVQRTFDPHCALSEDVREKHGGTNIGMAQQLLNRANIAPCL